MNLIKRYVHAVKMWLPENEQKEFLGELEDDLMSQAEARSAELGRELSEEEVSELLKRKGHPMVVATRLLGTQQLIGPTWYPVWRLAVRAMVVWILSPLFVLILGPLAAIASNEPGSAYVEAVLRLPVAAFSGVAAVTFVIACLERLELKVDPFESWRPESLPEAPGREGEHIPRCGSVVEMAGSMFLLLWWVGLIEVPRIKEVQVTLGPAWETLYWPVLLVITMGIVFSAVKLLRPYWRPSYSVFGIAQQSATLALAAVLLWSEAPVTVTVAGASAEKAAKIASFLDWSIAMTLIGAMAVAAITIFLEARKLAGKKGGETMLKPC